MSTTAHCPSVSSCTANQRPAPATSGLSGTAGGEQRVGATFRKFPRMALRVPRRRAIVGGYPPCCCTGNAELPRLLRPVFDAENFGHTLQTIQRKSAVHH